MSLYVVITRGLNHRSCTYYQASLRDRPSRDDICWALGYPVVKYAPLDSDIRTLLSAESWQRTVLGVSDMGLLTDRTFSSLIDGNVQGGLFFAFGKMGVYHAPSTTGQYKCHRRYMWVGGLLGVSDFRRTTLEMVIANKRPLSPEFSRTSLYERLCRMGESHPHCLAHWLLSEGPLLRVAGDLLNLESK